MVKRHIFGQLLFMIEKTTKVNCSTSYLENSENKKRAVLDYASVYSKIFREYWCHTR